MYKANRERLVGLAKSIFAIASPLRKVKQKVDFLVQLMYNEFGLEPVFDEAGKSKFADFECGNVKFELPATPGYAHIPAIVLDAHTDTVKVAGDHIEVIVDGDVIRTDGKTILGADDGCAIAAIIETLWILTDRRQLIDRPRLIIIFSIGEESAMYGWREMSPDWLRGADTLICAESVNLLPLLRACSAKEKGLVSFSGKNPVLKIASALETMRSNGWFGAPIGIIHDMRGTDFYDKPCLSEVAPAGTNLEFPSTNVCPDYAIVGGVCTDGDTNLDLLYRLAESLGTSWASANGMFRGSAQMDLYRETFKVEFHGNSCHSGLDPENGVNAAFMAAQFVSLAHNMGLFSKISLTQFSTHRGATVTNRCAETFLVGWEFRSYDEEGMSVRQSRAIELLARWGFQVWERFKPYGAVRVPEDHPTIQLGLRAMNATGILDPEAGAIDGSTHLNVALGRFPYMSGFVLGCGGRDAHKASEHVIISEMVTAAEVMVQFIALKAEN